MSTNKYLLGCVALVVMAVMGVSWRTMAAQPAANAADYGYFYRLNVKVSHKDEMFDMNMVVSCNPWLVPKFGMGAIQYLPQFYAERTKANHAIGVRITLGCEGHTTANGGAPADLLPSIYWFPDADDMTFAIMYASEDAYVNPLSQLKFHGATMHSATIQEFVAFQEAAKIKSIVPVNVWRLPVRDPKLGPFLVEEIEAAGGRAPKPNWAVSGCQSVKKLELSEQAREILRKYWPADKPRYWKLDRETMTKFEREAGSKGGTPEKAGFYKRPLLVNDEYVVDYYWTFALPGTDGLPTRAGGGRLRQLNRAGFGQQRSPPEKVPTIYPVAQNTSLFFYNLADKATSNIWARIDEQGGQTKGFAYCQATLNLVTQRSGIDSSKVYGVAHFLPEYRTKSATLFVDKTSVHLTMPPLMNPYNVVVDFIFERDQFLYFRGPNYF
jgi:hypothetical protein